MCEAVAMQGAALLYSPPTDYEGEIQRAATDGVTKALSTNHKPYDPGDGRMNPRVIRRKPTTTTIGCSGPG